MKRTGKGGSNLLAALVLALLAAPSTGAAAPNPCDAATVPSQCAIFSSGTLPPFVHDAITSKGGAFGAGSVLVLTSGDPADADQEISNDMSRDGCGTNPDGWQTYDCNLLDNFVPAEDSVVLALSSEWFEWYQTVYTDWMTISAGGVATVDVSINSWINNKVDVIPYGPMETGVVILTSLSKDKMVSFRVADSGDHIYDTAIVVVPATWFASVSGSSQDQTLLCGDGKLDPGEDCDDGNSTTDDGCSSICIGTQPPPSLPASPKTCGNLAYAWPNGTTAPYTCGEDACAGYRCVLGTTISPACYTAEQCAAACAGTCVDIPTAQLDCSTMCSLQPPASDPPPVVPPTCANLVYSWPDGSTLPYTCGDECKGERCVLGTTISPACYAAGECDSSCSGTCVEVQQLDCAALCELADQVVAAQADPTCDPAIDTAPRLAANQKGPCLSNTEICKDSGNGFTWRLSDGSWEPSDETCNGIDDDCNGVADDMFETCGDPGLCQNTVNTCDPDNPGVPVACVTLPPPSPFEICNDGLDNDCDGDADDGCECGDDDCMPGETFANCAADCPPPANGTPCDDGNFCTLGDAFQNGTCLSGSTVNTCDDGNACTTNELCDPSTGCAATKLDCDDHDACTIDACDADAGCVHSPNPECQSPDADGDGSPDDVDCDDGNAAVHPGAAELCNGIDDDCEGGMDEGYNAGTPCQSEPNDCGVADDGAFACTADGSATVCNAAIPANPPGYGDVCTSTPNVCGASATGTVRCDGSCSASAPAAADADADGTPDCLDQCPSDPAKTAPGLCGCGSAETVLTFYRDLDQDGFGNPAASTEACQAPAGYVANASDCDDSQASVHPGAAEVCNGVDDDCDGQLEQAVDADNDGVEDCGADLCLGTRADHAATPRVPLLTLLPKHWELRNRSGKFVWATHPQDKPSSFKPTIADTHGCSCKQILDARAVEAHGWGARLSILGQYLFGCTKGTLQEWSAK